MAGAKVVVAGRSYEADGRGQVLAESAPLGSLVDVTAPDFLDRQTLIRSASGGRFVLWPRATSFRIDETYTAQLVYTATDAPGLGSSPLRRPRLGATQAFLVVTPQIRQDDLANAVHQSAVAQLNKALAGRFTYVLATERPPAGLIFDARVDSDDAYCVENRRVRAYASVTTQAGEITGGRIVYCWLDPARSSTVAHELGHTFGLYHSPYWQDVMYGLGSASFDDEFSAREALTMAMMLERRGGNRFPDNDRAVPAAAGATHTIVCR